MFRLSRLSRIRVPRRPQPLSASRPIRFAHTIPRPPARPAAAASRPSASSSEAKTGIARSAAAQSPQAAGKSSTDPAERVNDRPSYELTFTCIPCGERSRHNISKQGYHYGSVLITCPSCRNRHVISDHLGIFGDRKVTVEDLMREKGRLVKKGTLGEDGDVEFWEDGTSTPHEAMPERGQQVAAESARDTEVESREGKR